MKGRSSATRRQLEDVIEAIYLDLKGTCAKQRLAGEVQPDQYSRGYLEASSAAFAMISMVVKSYGIPIEEKKEGEDADRD